MHVGACSSPTLDQHVHTARMGTCPQHTQLYLERVDCMHMHSTSGESMNPLALAKPTMRTYSQPRRKAHTERAPINRSKRAIDRQIDRQSDR
eukprot:scaffold127149_cov63-Phaeocystis_antarctica.AAC.2